MQCNIDSKGRKIRGINALILILASLLIWWFSWPTWIVVVLGLSGLFSAYEALTSWCVLRALGVKTKY